MSDREPGPYEGHHDAIRKEYRKQAPHWAKRETSPHLQWVVDNLESQSYQEVLDVASGTGLLARAVAPRVKRVVASDITPEMQALGRDEADRDGTTNVEFEYGMAEDLPYPDSSFDMVMTRFSVHHFLRPEAAVMEMRRVCRPGGKVVVIDITSPEDEELSARYNELERSRDRTHTRALSAHELNEIVGKVGLEITARRSREVEMNVCRWLDSAQVGGTERARILAAINEELDGLGETGLRPFVQEDGLMFMHVWEMVVGEKPPE